MTALQTILTHYRQASKTEREKGTYFEELMLCYFRNEASYKNRFSKVCLYADWAREEGLNAQDTGIDLVALDIHGEYHAIQCKLYAEEYKLQKSDIDSFFTASGKKPFSHRIIVSTTSNWSHHASDALDDQHIPVTLIDMQRLEESQIDWAQYSPDAPAVIKEKKRLRSHQVEAFTAVTEKLALADRGKLIMACGTGKTFTSLKIAEHMAGKGGRVLFLVSSLALLSQSLTEWTQESDIPLTSFAVCSDSDVGKKRSADDDRVQTYIHELFYPATTDAETLGKQAVASSDGNKLTVVFATYHSIDVVSQAQHHFGLGDFDLIVCDEAHRTTGAKFDDEDESHFIKVHNSDFIRAKKRLYMTATPRIYGNTAKAKAEQDSIVLCSMDDISLYGETLHTITFSEAVSLGLLVDYKVIVLAIEEEHVSKRIQELLKDESNQLKVDDATRIVGCWKALSKQWPNHEQDGDDVSMQRAVAFCQVIESNYKGKKHKVSSKEISSMFSEVVEVYRRAEIAEGKTDIPLLKCEADHVDGSMNASKKEEKLNWLKADVPADTCRILSNVRCLSEGVDVPALDAVLFLSPRNSQVEVVQSVGRVMRNAPGKKMGYVVLPVVIPAGMEAHDALDSNVVYKVVWDVLQALRSHDDRFDAMINKLDLIGSKPKQMEVVAITDKVPVKKEKDASPAAKKAKTGAVIGSAVTSNPQGEMLPLMYEVGEIERAIYAKLVKKCGNRLHWEQWAGDIAKIANTHISRIQGILETPENVKERETFEAFATELRDDLNDSLSDLDIVEMLAQHLITKPVFDALFGNYDFAKHNPISVAMQDILEALQEHHLEKETDTLQRFYESVKERADGITTAHGRQRIILELYDKFFAKAFPRLQEKLGIVYTPVEVVDFIIHSVNDILQKEFGKSLGSEDVHILDPFTGTGTFITRLLQSGLLSPAEIAKKYKGQIHANELVLLAYYIAAINIESTYHGIVGGDYVPFEGICLTDTFQMSEKADLVDIILEDNSERRKKQMALDIRVIMGNPPYSVGQKNANDNNQNVGYPKLDERIAETYANRSDATNKNALYDSYIRAIRWASDRIKNCGVIGFVTNASFIDSNTADGLRQCLAEEFSNIYIFHLRGNQRTSGELSRKEGGKIFGGGSRAPIAISLLVKNPHAQKRGQIFFHDIGDYLNRDEKLAIIESYGSIDGITQAEAWQSITPDDHGDWVNQRDDSFGQFASMGDKKNPKQLNLFANYSRGLETGRDAWVYNSSMNRLATNMNSMIDTFNGEVKRFADTYGVLPPKEVQKKIDGFVSNDTTRISWTRNLRKRVADSVTYSFEHNKILPSHYRPFTKSLVYFDSIFNNYVLQMPRIFPDGETKNLVICVTGVGSRNGLSAFIADVIPDVQLQFNGQCFPLYLYEEPAKANTAKQVQGKLFDTPQEESSQERGLVRKDGITDEGLRYFQEAYPKDKLSKEDVFYYIYGLLHSEDYREKYADNLSKELPRIPRVKEAGDFWAFSGAGRELAELHLHYETVEKYPDVTIEITGAASLDELQPEAFRVEKMTFGKGKDKTTLRYNNHITVSNIPLEAYDYIVNGKAALDWVVERQCVKTDKASGIVNDANDWAIETMNNPRYPLELFLRVITVSLKTQEIVKALPKLNFDELT